MGLERYGVITGIVPEKEGWRYEQRLSDGSLQRIPFHGCAGSGSALVKEVTNFRAANMIDLGDVELDVANYIKEKSPINNRFPNRKTAPQPLNKRAIRPLIERIKVWLIAIAPKHPRLLIEDEAATRAKVCAQCPQNVDWRKGVGCAPCMDEIVLRGRHVRQRIDYPEADSLRACRIHDFYLPAAVFIDRDALPEAHEDAPSFCWLRTEKKQAP